MKVFGAFIILIAAVVFALTLSPLMQGMHDFRTDVQTDNFTVTTGAAVTSANLSLRLALYDGNLANLSVTSNVTADTPSVDSYNAASRTILVSSLAQSNTRVLTVSYDTPALDDYESVDDIVTISPNIWIAAAVAIPLGGLIYLFKRR